MRLAYTTHAVERWSGLVDPPIDWRAAIAEMKVACAATTARERVGRTKRGQPVYRVNVPREAYLVVVRKEDDSHTRNTSATVADGVVVTVLPRDLWVREPNIDTSQEILDAWDEQREWLPAPPRGHRFRNPPPSSVPSWPTASTPPLPASEDVLRSATVGSGPSLGSADAKNCNDWRSFAWTVAAIERERRMAEHFRLERELILEQHEVLAAAFRLVTGRGTIEELAFAFEAVKPGAIEQSKAKRGTS